MDFFEEEAIRINEGFLDIANRALDKFFAPKKDPMQIFIENNETKIKSILSKIFKENMSALSPYSKWSASYYRNAVYDGMWMSKGLKSILTVDLRKPYPENSNKIKEIIKERNEYYASNKSNDYKVKFHSVDRYDFKVTIEINKDSLGG